MNRPNIDRIKSLMCYLFYISICMTSCKKDIDQQTPDDSFSILPREEAQTWFEKYTANNDGASRNMADDNLTRKPLNIDWGRYTSAATNELSYGLIALEGKLKSHGYAIGYRKLLITKKEGDLHAYILEILPDALYLQRKGSATRKDFYGRIFFYDTNYHLIKGYIYINGQVSGEIKPLESDRKESKAKNQSIGIALTPVQEICSWNEDNYVNADGEVVVFASRQCTYSVISDGLSDAGGPSGSGGDYAGGGGGSGGSSDSAPPVADLPGENNSRIDPKAYMSCFGSLPDIGSKMTITVYVQEPAPGLPFNVGTNSVGHTAIGLTKTYNGQSITQVIGFYPDATGKAKMHAPSKILDNSGLSYNVSISYPIIASEFSKIVNFVSNPPDTYDLTQYNCTSFVYNACLAGGIKLPDPNGNMGLGMTGMMPSALGNSIRSVGNAGNANVNGGTVGKNHGPCN
ncbi:hypothetical protein FPZ42_06970 [Mucilaginibacter achroorhodeus]|uniref:Uncharacterized protein n=1 Tax=Mucilaginibacter achroorhodeus TaxID=2599294 RepID=A0A563U5Z9_9SPHI|nr:hypothetical protein [Mucilaginibacter achroorhodeus]TWR26772.1 hypothetical protein FPZ42_06970 [Mucilaginibacter achroorhodeus]